MFLSSRFSVLLLLASCVLSPQVACSEESQESLSVHEVRSLLNAIDPYLPESDATLSATVDIFGSTSMDTLVHGWATEFQRFHPQVKFAISAEGSETVFDRLAKNPGSLGMLSRPVTEAELDKLKKLGLKRPVAITVAREALGVFVNEGNPLEAITREQFFQMFCSANAAEKLEWGKLGVAGKLASAPVNVIAREKNSGTQKFVTDFLLAGQQLRSAQKDCVSNADVIKAVEAEPTAVAIAGLKCGGHGAKPLDLRDGANILSHDDHAVLMGQYPLIRPLTIVFDAGRDDEHTRANREFLRYALHQAGQSHTILCGFFPFDPPSLRGELLKLSKGAAQ